MTGGNGSDFIQLILWSEQKKNNSSEASRSLPGHASIILVLCFCVYILCLGGVFWLGFVRMPFSRRTGAGERGPVTRKLFWSFCCTAHAWVILSAHGQLVLHIL